MNKGPLAGIKVVELAGLAPAPFCGMVLADFGASVIRVDKTVGYSVDRTMRGKRSLALDLKKSEGISILKKLCRTSDVLIDPFRPGVLEKLGLGPTTLLGENPRFVYARITGYGQSGPWTFMAGHDINYIALSGMLSMLGRKHEKPYAPLNLVADFAGGGLSCVVGILMALFERQTSGKGQIVDMSMTEGAAYVGSWVYKSQNLPFLWGNKRGENLLDSGFPLYDTYETKDGKYMSVGALEPQFQFEFLDKIGLGEQISAPDILMDPEGIKKQLEAKFREKTREEWCKIFQKSDACVAPVLELSEIGDHEQHKERAAFRKTEPDADGGVGWEPEPAPRLSRTPAVPDYTDPDLGEHSVEILGEMGYGRAEIEKFLEEGVIEGRMEAIAKL